MSSELLMEGADAYTSLAEVAAASDVESPELSAAVSVIVSIATTFLCDC
ncbi:LxmA leader domain family RiPP [Herbidospora mongoliensis]|nr:LxmA leader domain family RiPP [Herbidospora mongoliensis]